MVMLYRISNLPLTPHRFTESPMARNAAVISRRNITTNPPHIPQPTPKPLPLWENRVVVAAPVSAAPSESGEIGRRTRLRIWRSNPWGFKSPLSHQPPLAPSNISLQHESRFHVPAQARRHSCPAHRQAHSHRGLPRPLRQQRAGPHECLGLLPRLRHHVPGRTRRGSAPQLPGYLPQPPAGQGPLERPRPQPRPVRADLRPPRPRAPARTTTRPRPLAHVH